MAHAASVIDELNTPPLSNALTVGAVLTVVDPRQFVDPDFNLQGLYQDQIGVCDVLVASKVDLCSDEVMTQFRERAAKLFPPKALVAEVNNV